MIHYTFSDSRGYVWFGTHNGLASWDGFRFKIFKHDRRDSTSISCNIVKFMLEDPDGSIWVGTVGGGLCQFDPVSNQFRRFAPLVISLQTMLVKVTNFSK
jgi:ligand-binding sensor domain-containing protein